MSNFPKEVLRLTIDRLENKVANVMLKISILLADTKNISTVDNLEELLYELDRHNGALTKAQTIQSQLDKEENMEELIKQRAEMLMNMSKTNNIEEENKEDDGINLIG